MTSKERFDLTVNHKQPDRVVVDLESTAVTGIHVLSVENLRRYYGLEIKPVRVIEPYHMLGESTPFTISRQMSRLKILWLW